MTTPITSLSQWQGIVSSSSVVVADFYADWCGPCKMIAPTFESLATKYAKPGRIVFAKINTDDRKDVAQRYGVSAMPTFIILTNGIIRETIKGADPPQLMTAVAKYVKSAGAAPFSSPGRTLGGTPSAGSTATAGAGGIFGRLFSSPAPAATPAANAGAGAANPPRPRAAAAPSVARSFDLNRLVDSLITIFGLYFVSLFSLDPFMAAQNSKFNIQNPTAPIQIPSVPLRTAGSGSSSGTRAAGGGTTPGRSGPQQRSSFKTLADLND